MTDKIEKKGTPGSEPVAVLGATFAEGKPEGSEPGQWRQKMASRTEKLTYLETAERYWYGKEWYGSEKRKKPA